MFEFIQDDNFLNDDQKKFISNSIFGNSFNWYHMEQSIETEVSDILLSHIVVQRPEHGQSLSKINSDYFKDMLSILTTFTDKHNIKLNTLLRCSINYTFNNGIEKCRIHRDHEFEHKQLLLCLNDPIDKQASTVILHDDEKTEYKRISPKQYQAICFNNKPHYHFYPKVGHRVMAVFTFT